MKRILSLTIVLALLLGTVTTAFAADLDLINQADSTKNFSWNEFVRVSANLRYVGENMKDYLIEYKGESYNAEEVDAAIKAGAKNFDEAIKDLEPVDKPAEGLKVVEVSAINANYVVVKITAPEEDLLAQEVEVKNGAGVVVPVKPLDIAAGDETAEFEFVTAVKSDDLKGIWTVNGQPYDLDLLNNLKAFLDAGNQLALNKALTDLGIENVKVENMPEYFEAKEKLNVTSEELTLADVQKLVDDVNAKAVDSEEEAAIVKAVVDAKKAGNEVALLQALQNDAFVRVNPEWVAVATNGYMAKITEDEETIEAIQTVINNSNDAIIKAEIEALGDNNIKKDDLLKVKALEEYATLNKDGKIKETDIENGLEKIEEQLAVVAVLEATTPTALKARITELAEIANPAKGDKRVDMENYRDANGKAYLAYIADENNTVNTPEAVNTALTTVNGKIDGRLTVTEFKVKDVKDYDSTAKGEVRVLGYWVKVNVSNGENDYTVKDTDSIVIELYDGETLLGKQSLNAEGYKKHSDKKEIGGTIDAYGEYVATSWDHEWYGELTDIPTRAVAKVKYKVDGAVAEAENKTLSGSTDVFEGAIVADLVEALNEAETVADVKDVLDALADVGKVEDYLKIRSADRDFVAAYVLKYRPEETGYDELSAVETQVTNAVTAHGKALDAVNELKYTSTPDEVVEALDKILDEDFDKLSNIGKINAAEAFHDKLVFDEEGALKTPFRTLADVKALLK